MPRDRFCERDNATLVRELDAWWAGQPGDRVRQHEREVLNGMVGELFGYQLLQVGELGRDLGHLVGCPIRYKTLVAQQRRTGYDSLIVALPHSLPVLADSVDAIILPHTLDFSPDPHQVLREAERVLIPEGRVIVTGFNPFSLWGLWRMIGRWRRTVPWCGHFLSYPRLNDWLSLMGFDVERTDVLEFRPPVGSAHFDGIERMGHRLWPMFAGVYVVQAVKRVSRVTPLRPRWSRLRVFGGSRAIEPTARQIEEA